MTDSCPRCEPLRKAANDAIYAIGKEHTTEHHSPIDCSDSLETQQRLIALLAAPAPPRSDDDPVVPLFNMRRSELRRKAAEDDANREEPPRSGLPGEEQRLIARASAALALPTTPEFDWNRQNVREALDAYVMDRFIPSPPVEASEREECVECGHTRAAICHMAGYTAKSAHAFVASPPAGGTGEERAATDAEIEAAQRLLRRVGRERLSKFLAEKNAESPPAGAEGARCGYVYDGSPCNRTKEQHGGYVLHVFQPAPPKSEGEK